MNRIPPSQKIGKKLEQLLNQGLDGEEDITSVVVRLGVERVVQEMVEQEVTDYLERGHYERRRPEQEHRGYRNGYEPGRIRTAEGEIVVQVPQVRDGPETHRSRADVHQFCRKAGTGTGQRPGSTGIAGGRRAW